MQLSLKTIILAAVALIAAGVLIGSKMFKAEPQIETRTVTKDRVVTVTKEVKSPNGTVVREEVKTEERKSDQQIAIAPPVKPDWLLTGGIRPQEQHYMLGVQRRIIGDVYGGLQVDTQRNAFLTISILF